MADAYNPSSPDDQPQSPCQQVRKLYENHVGIWAKYWDAMERESRFLDGDRYLPDHGSEGKDRRLTQIRGQETQDTIRHVTADSTSRPSSIEARIVSDDAESMTDEEIDMLAEVDQELVNRLLSDPWKGFDDLEYEAVQSAREMRLGTVWMDWEPTIGNGGDILFRYIHPTRQMWQPPYKDPHHPMCRWFLEKARVDVDWLHARYPGSEWVRPDIERLDEGDRVEKGVPLISVGGNHSLSPTAGVKDNKAEIWFCWYKYDPTMAEKDTGRDLSIAPEDQYMACADGCGYRSPTQSVLSEQDKIEEGLPDMIDGGCPDCGGNLVRVETKAETENAHAFTKGRRLVIISPFNKGPEDKPIYDGDWPIPEVRSFPGYFIQSYVKPGRPIGPSDVFYMWDQQVASDNLRTIAVQRVFEHRTYWELAAAGPVDRNGARFTFRDDQRNVIYRDANKMSQDGRPAVQAHNSTGLDTSGWQLAFQAAQQALTQYRPGADFGLTPESSKDIPVGTLQQIQQVGNIPISDFIRRKNRAKSKFLGCVSDYLHATVTPEKLSRMNIEGVDIVAGLWGDALPAFEYVVEETPPFSGLEKARADAFNSLFDAVGKAAQLGLPPDEVIDVAADVQQLPRSTVRKFKRILQAAQEPPPGAPPGPEGPGGGGLEDMLAAEANGGGMAPQSNVAMGG